MNEQQQQQADMVSLIMAVNSLNVKDDIKADLLNKITKVVNNIIGEHRRSVTQYMTWLGVYNSTLQDIKHQMAFVAFEIHALKKENEDLKKALED
jgi:hypothetical protein